MFKPVATRNSSPVRWPCVPCPGEPQLMPFGSAATCAMKPLTSRIGCSAFTTMASGGPPSSAMWLKSFIGSKPAGDSIGAMTCEPMPEITSV